MTKKKEEVVEGQQEIIEQQQQQKNDFYFALAGIRLECCKLAKSNNEVNLTKAEKLFQYVISGTK